VAIGNSAGLGIDLTAAGIVDPPGHLGVIAVKLETPADYEGQSHVQPYLSTGPYIGSNYSIHSNSRLQHKRPYPPIWILTLLLFHFYVPHDKPICDNSVFLELTYCNCQLKIFSNVIPLSVHYI